MPDLTLAVAQEATQAVRDCFGELDTENHCDIASECLTALLQQRGYRPRVIGGTFFCDSHFWVECDGILMDPTIDQFDDRRPLACAAAAARGSDLYIPGKDVPSPTAEQTIAVLARAGVQYRDSAPIYAAMHALLTA